MSVVMDMHPCTRSVRIPVRAPDAIWAVLLNVLDHLIARGTAFFAGGSAIRYLDPPKKRNVFMSKSPGHLSSYTFDRRCHVAFPRIKLNIDLRRGCYSRHKWNVVDSSLVAAVHLHCVGMSLVRVYKAGTIYGVYFNMLIPNVVYV